MEQTIGIIGYGSLGHAIAERSEELGYRVMVSDGEQNKEVAQEAQILALCVKPCKASEIADQIRSSLNGASIVSFMAAVPIDKLREEISPKVQRAMTNLGLDSISCTDGDERITRFCEHLSRGGVEKTSIESQVDLFTIAIGCLPGVTAWMYQNHPEKADQWLSQWTEFLHSETGIAKEVFSKIIEEVKETGEYEETVKRVQTPGGVTQSMLEQLEQDPNTNLEKILLAATERTAQIAKEV